MKIEIPGLDIQKGLELYDDDEELYAIVLRSYVNNTPSVLDRLRNVTAENLEEYSVNVHGIKGTSITIAADEIQQDALNLELMAKEGNLSGVLEVNNSFIEKVETLVSEIKIWLDANDA